MNRKLFSFPASVGAAALLFINLITISPLSAAERTADDYDDPALLAATRVFGALKVEPGIFETESDLKPWSAWWYPYWDSELFKAKKDPKNPNLTQLSPLEKYDLYVKAMTGVNPGAAEYESKYLYDPHADHWAGRCNAWALASIIAAEPKQPIRAAGIDFSVADLKALLIKTYENSDPSEHFGQLFQGTWEASVYKDIYPDQFHRFFQVQAFEKHLPFIIDHDAGVQIWNVPVWAVKTTITPDKADKEVMHVRTTIVYARSNDVAKNNHGIIGTDPGRKTYTYDLIGAKNPRTGIFTVKFGVWTGDSRADHPDYAITLPSKIERTSRNEKLDPKWVDKILGSTKL